MHNENDDTIWFWNITIESDDPNGFVENWGARGKTRIEALESIIECIKHTGREGR